MRSRIMRRLTDKFLFRLRTFEVVAFEVVAFEVGEFILL